MRKFCQSTRLIPVLLSFAAFLAIRALAVFVAIPSIAVLIDSGYYVAAGTAYVRGALPDSLNPEHPPLAKYIIGFFAVYFGNPSLASYVFGFLSVVAAYFLARRLLSKKKWATVTVWLVAFDSVSISTFLYPVLDGFMLFFALASICVLLRSEKLHHYALAGMLMGLAVACKWNALFFAAPEIIFIVASHKYFAAVVSSFSSSALYVASYSALIAAKGLNSFLNLQLWMTGFMLGAHGLGPTVKDIIGQLILPFIFHTTTFGAVTGYNSAFHPEGFNLLGRSYISFADLTNAPILLLLFPLIYWLLRRFTPSDSARKLMLWILASLIVWEILFVNSLETWFFAPIIAMIAIGAAPMLEEIASRGSRERLLAYSYLGLVALWPLIASAIVVLRVVYYWTYP
jgi:hypothetical protein